MAQVFLYPATGESPLDEDGNPFPATGLRVTMNAYYEGQCRQGLLVRQDPSAFSAVAQPAVYAPFSLGYVTTQLATLPISRDQRELTTVGYATAGDNGGATWVGRLGVSSGANGYTKINTSDGQWQMLLSYDEAVSITQIGCLPTAAGAGTCGTRISAYLADWKTTHGINTVAKLYVPSIPVSTTLGYYIDTPIYIPDQLRLQLMGSGRVNIGTFDASTSSTGAYRAGSVFTVAPNINGIEALGGGSAVYPELDMRDVGFLGPGAPNTTGSGLDTYLFGKVSTTNCAFHGLRRGMWLRASVIHRHQNPVAYGNQYGIVCGGPAAELVDGWFDGIDLSGNEFALALESVADTRITGLIQGNKYGLVVGRSDGNHGIYNTSLELRMEGNGDDVGGPFASGGKHVLTYPASPTYGVTNLEFRRLLCSGTSVASTPRDITLQSGYVCKFDLCATNGIVTVPDAFVQILGPSRKGGFTSISVQTNSIISIPNPGSGDAGTGGVLGGSYTHDWANTGERAEFVLVNNSTINLPINAPAGAKVRYVFRQDGTGGRTVTWNAGFRMDTWNTTGAATPASMTSIEFQLQGGGGVWVQCTAQPAFGWVA